MRSAASSGRFGVGAAADEFDLVVGVELLEHVGLELAVLAHRFDDLLALLVRGRFDEVGDLGGMEPGQLAERDAQARRGDMGHEGLDARPVDDLPGRDAPSQGTRQEMPQRHPGTGVDRHHLPAPFDAGQLDLVGPDEACPVEVDDVAGEEVAGQEQLAGPALEALEAHLVAGQLHPAGSQGDHPADGDEEVPAADADDDAGQRRMGGVAEADEEVADAPQAVPAPVDDGALHHGGEVQDLDGHG